jgi:putative ribosome biogenesis GTPase RsgA
MKMLQFLENLSTYCNFEAKDENGIFLLAKPNYNNLSAVTRAPKPPKDFNTIHIGDTGAGKTSLIASLQPAESQTCFPCHEELSAGDQLHVHRTTVVSATRGWTRMR